MKQKFLIIIISILILLAGSFVFKGKMHYTTYSQAYEQFKNINMQNYTEAFASKHPRSIYVNTYEQIDSLASLKKKSEAIALVKCLKQAQYDNVISSQLQVEKVFQGHLPRLIDMYESCQINAMQKNMTMYGPHTPMKKGDSYLVCLKKSQYHHGFYHMVNTVLAVYPIKKLKKKTFPGGEEVVTKRENLEYDMLDVKYVDPHVNNRKYRKAMNDYPKFRRALFKQYGLAGERS